MIEPVIDAYLILGGRNKSGPVGDPGGLERPRSWTAETPRDGPLGRRPATLEQPTSTPYPSGLGT